MMDIAKEITKASDLLLQAVQSLQKATLNSPSSSNCTEQSTVVVTTASRPSHTVGRMITCSGSPKSELKDLFNWSGSKHKSATKRKVNSVKKKKLQWTHTFCCLASQSQR